MNLADAYKPKLKPLRSLNQLKIDEATWLQAKADGEFAVTIYENGKAYTLNRWGTRRENLPCLLELEEKLRRVGVKSLILLGELYVYDGKPKRLPDFIRASHSQPEKVSLGLFGLVKVNGKPVYNNWAWQVKELETWLKENSERLHVLPYQQVSNLKEAEEFWEKWVLKVGYEGVVARNMFGGFKIKPEQTLDALVVGVNKRPALKHGRVTSLALALMDKDGCLIHIGDVSSGIDPETGYKLYTVLDKLKTGEDRETIYVEPILIVEVRFYETFQSQRKTWKLQNGKYVPLQPRNFYSLKSPVLLRFREDKKFCIRDIGTDQIP